MTPRHTPPRRGRRRRSPGPLVAAAALLAGAVGAGGTVALWSSDGSSPMGVVTAGDLDIDLVGSPVWRETSADVTGTPRAIEPADFLARPGDTVTLAQDFRTELQGDNMLGRITVDWEQPPALAVGVSATYSVRDSADALVVEDVALGDAGTLAPLDTDDDGRSDTFTLEVTIAFDREMDDRFAADAAAQVADLGTVVIDLDQVRAGEGFTS
ncbi:MAG TPA: alternate-type signal peptide domain-containing protein [Phototrophicaceae bacterium]|nr:alternate-type signal peptide domain-containing protein [Phototrophicaceae bacterium]